MASLLDNIEILEETDDHITYIDEDGTYVVETFDDYPLIDMTEEPSSDQEIDPENPALVEFRALLFNQVYHQLDIREWVV